MNSNVKYKVKNTRTNKTIYPNKNRTSSWTTKYFVNNWFLSDNNGWPLDDERFLGIHVVIVFYVWLRACVIFILSILIIFVCRCPFSFLFLRVSHGAMLSFIACAVVFNRFIVTTKRFPPVTVLAFVVFNDYKT